MTCRAVVSPVVSNITLILVDNGGDELARTEETMPVTVEIVATLEFMLEDLATSDAGQYSCVVLITGYEEEDILNITSPFILTVESMHAFL